MKILKKLVLFSFILSFATLTHAAKLVTNYVPFTATLNPGDHVTANYCLVDNSGTPTRFISCTPVNYIYPNTADVSWVFSNQQHTLALYQLTLFTSKIQQNAIDNIGALTFANNSKGDVTVDCKYVNPT